MLHGDISIPPLSYAGIISGNSDLSILFVAILIHWS